MRIFLDTEFTDFHDIDLISLGCVSQDGVEFYAERDDYNKTWSSQFVQQVIEPLLGKQPTRVMNASLISAQLYQYLLQWKSEGVIISVDYMGDWELFCDLMHGYDMSFVQGQNINGCINKLMVADYFRKTGLPNHHALTDAHANRFAFCEPSNTEF